MKSVNIHEAKTHLSKLIQKAANGESFIIAKAGKPMVKVISIDAPPPNKTRRLGFLKGQFKVPDDIKTMFKDEINQLFFSALTIWEVAIKSALNKKDFDTDARLLYRGLLDAGYIELPVT